jgi:hypothetical protein
MFKKTLHIAFFILFNDALSLIKSAPLYNVKWEHDYEWWLLTTEVAYFNVGVLRNYLSVETEENQ